MLNEIMQIFSPKKVVAFVVLLVAILWLVHTFAPANWKSKIGIA